MIPAKRETKIKIEKVLDFMFSWNQSQNLQSLMVP